MTWPATTILAQPGSLGVVSQAFDPRTRTDFALTAGAHGSFALRRTSLTGGKVKLGPSFPVSLITLADGSVWVYGTRLIGSTAERQKLYQVNPRTLAIVRSWTLGPSLVKFGAVAVAPGAHRTVWVAFGRTVRHLNPLTGAAIGAIRVPAGLIAGAVAQSPSGRDLYVGTSDQIGSRSPVFEYSVATGRKLAANTRTVTAVAVGGGSLTAVPGGVWDSFRTGMAGLTVLLRQRDLHAVRLPGTGSRHSLFSWQMGAGTTYAAPSVYLIQLFGVAGCMNPRTGHIRARGTIAGHAEVEQILASARGGRVIYAASSKGVLAIRPPAACRA